MNLVELFEGIGNEFDLDPIEIEESGRYLLTIGNKYFLNIEKSEDQNIVHLYAYIYPDLGEYTQFVSMKLMEINAFGNITGSSQLSYSPEDSKFVLSESFMTEEASLAFIMFRIQEFIRILKFFHEKWNQWQLELVSASKKEQEETATKKGQVVFKL